MDTGSQERMESWERPPELRVTPGPLPTPVLFQETGPRGPLEKLDDQARGHLFAVGSLNASSQPSEEMAPAGSPHRSLELSLVASPQASVERAQPLSSQFSLEDLYYSQPQPYAAGDRPELKEEKVPRIPSVVSVPGPSAGGPTTLSPSGGFQPQQPGRADARPSALHYRMGRKAAMARLDPARLSRHWVHPLAEILVPDSETCPPGSLPRAPAGREDRGPSRTASLRPQRPRLPVSVLPYRTWRSFPSLGTRPQPPIPYFKFRPTVARFWFKAALR